MKSVFLSVWIFSCLATGLMMTVHAEEFPKTRAKLAAHEPVKIVCLGDSVTGIYYHTGGLRAYPEMIAVGMKLLDPQSKVTVVNSGISGHSTANGLERFQKDVLDHKPDLVTVMFGLNDIVRVPLPDFEANLKTFIEKNREMGAETLLCTPNGIYPTPGRPVEKLEEYNQAMKAVAEANGAGFCNVYGAYQAVKSKNELDFRLLCSDPFHPNMDGHKLNAETIIQSITGKKVSLQEVGPPAPVLAKTKRLIAEKQPVHILAMTPFDEWIGPALKAKYPDAQLEVAAWPTKDKSLAELHEAAKQVRERNPKPDLVVVAIPLEVTPPLSQPPEADIDNHSWTLNYALSFGVQEWDLIAVTPSVLKPELTAAEQDRDAFSRRMIFAQDLPLITRPAGSTDDPKTILTKWLAK